MKHIILCADDYGQNIQISQAIIELLQNKRLSAVSCMTTTTDFEDHAAWLKPFKLQADIGLHFNLTLGPSCPSHPQLLTRAYLRLLDKQKLKNELNQQLDRFWQIFASAPDFIDGHQHIHQLPLIRDVLLEVYAERLRSSGCYIRSTDGSLKSATIKQLIIQFCGASSLKKQLIVNKIPHNSSFSGIYAFSDAKKYAQHFAIFLQKIHEKGLIMCHPGLAGDDSDVIYASRPLEYQFLMSDAFVAMCQAQNVILSRFKDFV